MRSRFFTGSILFCCLLAAASAQVTLASFTFEGDTPGNLPAGWLSGTNTFKAVANPSMSGINTSSQVGGWTGTDSTDSALINLTGYTSGYTFTLSFDLYDPDSTTTHGLLTGYGVSGGSSDAWTIGATGANSGATMFDDLSATGTWQHFSFDFTTVVDTYLAAHPGQAANFAIMFDMWNVGNGTRPNLDNVTFTATAIPEPSTYAALAGAAALGLAALHRRRRAA